jgi:hypothetical protein
MDRNLIAGLREHAEPLAALSLWHLTPVTRQKLLDDDLSVNAYPTGFGGLVFVGAPRYSVPAEPDLALIFEAAEQAGIVWLKFDREAAVLDGLQVFETEPPP